MMAEARPVKDGLGLAVAFFQFGLAEQQVVERTQAVFQLFDRARTRQIYLGLRLFVAMTFAAILCKDGVNLRVKRLLNIRG